MGVLVRVGRGEGVGTVVAVAGVGLGGTDAEEVAVDVGGVALEGLLAVLGAVAVVWKERKMGDESVSRFGWRGTFFCGEIIGAKLIFLKSVRSSVACYHVPLFLRPETFRDPNMTSAKFSSRLF